MEAEPVTRAAARAARASIDDDARQASLASPAECFALSERARSEMRPQSAVVFACKAVGVLPDALTAAAAQGHALGLALGEAGHTSAAYEVLGRVPGVPAATSRAVYAALLGAEPEAVRLLCEAAKALPGSLSRANKVHLARHHWLYGELETAAQLAAEAASDRGKGCESTSVDGALMQAETDAALYAEEAWPGQGGRRPACAAASGGAEVWLQRGHEKLAAVIKRDVHCVRAHALHAELYLEAALHGRILRMPAKARAAAGRMEGGDGGSCDDEIRALCRMHGLDANKLDEPAERLRVIEAHRTHVLDAGGPDATAEADELGKLHEYQMRQLGQRCTTGAAGPGALVGEVLAGAGVSVPDALVQAGLAAVEAALRVERVRHAPVVLLLKGRLLLLCGQAADALVPLNACMALLEPKAAWRQQTEAAVAAVYGGAALRSTSRPGKESGAASAAPIPSAEATAPTDAAGGPAAVATGPPLPLPARCAVTPARMMATAHNVDYCTAALYTGLAAAAAGVEWRHACTPLSLALAAAPTAEEAAAVAAAGGGGGGLLARHGSGSVLNPDLHRAARILAQGQLLAGIPEAAAAACELGLALAAALLGAIGSHAAGARAVRLEQVLTYECLVRSLGQDGREDEALRACTERALPCVRASALEPREMAARLRSVAELWIDLAPHCAAAHATRAEALLAQFEADATADAAAGSEGGLLLREAKEGYNRAIALEGIPQGVTEPTRCKMLASAAAVADVVDQAAVETVAAAAEAPTIKAHTAKAPTAKIPTTKAPMTKALPFKVPAAVTPAAKAPAAKASPAAKSGVLPKPRVAKVSVAPTASGSGLRAVQALSPERQAGKPPPASAKGGKEPSRAPLPGEVPALVVQASVPVRQGTGLAGPSRTAAASPAEGCAPAALATPSEAPAQEAPSARLLDPAALRVLVAEARAARAACTPTAGAPNPPSAFARLGLVRACRELGEPTAAMRAILEEAVSLGGDLPATLYEELGNMLKADGEGERAIDLWCSYPFSPPPSTFDENVLRLSAANLIVALGLHADPAQHERLKGLLIGVGKGFGGTSHVDKHVDALETAGFVQLCKDVYCGITGMPEEDQRALFQSKGWAPAFSSLETISKPLGRRAKAPPRQPGRPTPNPA